MKSIIYDYLSVRKSTYQIFENHLLPHIKSLLRGNLTYYDLTMLFQIQNSINHAQNRPTDIAFKSKVSLNNLSYRLSRLESKKLIFKKPSLNDHRETYIYIAPEGYELLEIYRDLYRRFAAALRAQFTKLELIVFVRGWIKVSNVFSAEPPIQYNALRVKMFPTWLQMAGTRFYNIIIEKEEALLESYGIPCSLREWAVLVEIYLLSQSGSCTLTELQNHLNYPISSISTIAKRYEGHYVHKHKDPSDHRITYLAIDESHHPIFDAYIKQRLDIQKTIRDVTSKKEYTLIIEAFKSIKAITLESNLKES